VQATAEEARTAQGVETGQTAPKSTDAVLGEQCGVDPRTARRDARFAAALDSLAANLGAEFRTLVLTRKSNLSRRDVVRLAAMAQQERERFLRRQEEEKSRPRPARRQPAANGNTRPETRNGVRGVSVIASADEDRHAVAPEQPTDKVGPRQAVAGTLGRGPDRKGPASPATSKDDAPSIGLQRLNESWDKAVPDERRLFAARPDVRATVEEAGRQGKAGKDKSRKQSA